MVSITALVREKEESPVALHREISPSKFPLIRVNVVSEVSPAKVMDLSVDGPEIVPPSEETRSTFAIDAEIVNFDAVIVGEKADSPE